MKRFFYLFLLITLFVAYANAQDKPKPDTIEMGGLTIIRDNLDTIIENPRKGILKKFGTHVSPRNVKTEWGLFDIGFSNFVDNTQFASTSAQAYAPGGNSSWFEIKPYKSPNVNIWIVMQQFNLIDHFINFKYGVGLEFNNYRYSHPIRYDANPAATENAPVVSIDAKAIAEPPARIYKKDKLAVNYITIPLMLNFNFTPQRLYNFELSTGISVGYLFASRNKTITSDEGKLKAKDDFDLRHWKLSYIADLTLGVITVYSSYAFKGMYKRGLDMTPYNFGIRIRAIDFFNKLE
jgi:hypothetical protein